LGEPGGQTSPSVPQTGRLQDSASAADLAVCLRHPSDPSPTEGVLPNFFILAVFLFKKINNFDGLDYNGAKEQRNL
jgi:hypothetical protein